MPSHIWTTAGLAFTSSGVSAPRFHRKGHGGFGKLVLQPVHDREHNLHVFEHAAPPCDSRASKLPLRSVPKKSPAEGCKRRSQQRQVREVRYRCTDGRRCMWIQQRDATRSRTPDQVMPSPQAPVGPSPPTGGSAIGRRCVDRWGVTILALNVP